MKPHIAAAHDLWKKHLTPNDLVVDATLGNGHDTIFLSSLVPNGHVFAYDIQTTPLALPKNVSFFHKSHTSFSDLPQNITLFVYNLGYLPGGDKTITTKAETTLQSVKSALTLLAKKSLICITCYPGHEEGERESLLLLNFAKHLDKKKYSVELQQWINREKSPFLIIIRQLISF